MQISRTFPLLNWPLSLRLMPLGMKKRNNWLHQLFWKKHCSLRAAKIVVRCKIM